MKKCLKIFQSIIQIGNSKKILIFLMLISILYYQNAIQKTYLQNKSVDNVVVKPNVKLFNLNKALEPKEIYDSIKCRVSANIYNVNTTLCIHDQDRDSIVSKSIWETGIWEAKITSKIFILIYSRINQSLLM